jgi:hypothetical protein
MEDILTDYLAYTSNTEVPTFFNRWCLLSGIGAFLGRQYWFDHGHFQVHPNMYCMLIGSPGTRKSTAIKLIKKILTQAGYSSIAADKTSKEKFLMDLEGEDEDTTLSPEAFLDKSLFGMSNEPKQMYVMADEFNDFIGTSNMEFISLLGNLWDYSGIFKYRTKTAKSISIFEPTINILGGNTPKGFSTAFPPDILGQGFFSRLLLIYGESNGRSIPFPEPGDKTATDNIVSWLHKIKYAASGCAEINRDAKGLLSKIYENTRRHSDPRFDSYYNRRFTHLLKLCLIISAIRCGAKINEQDVIRANTLLRFTEQLMPKALGEFGKSKTSDVNQLILSALEAADIPLKIKDIWKVVHKDMEKMNDLGTLLQNLVAADKIQQLPNGLGFLPVRVVVDQSDDSSLVDWSYLTEEELRISK